MRRAGIMSITGYIIILFSFTFIIPLITGLIYGEEGEMLAQTYVLPMAISFMLGGFLWYGARGSEIDLREREAFVVVGLGWLIIAFLGSLPYIFGGEISNPLDAYFESMSGFTTTGATILRAPEGMDYLDAFPHSIMIWRSLTCWLGGMGIIVLSVVILARFLEGGLHLFKAEVSGASVTRIRPKLHQTARLLWGVYGFLTLLSVLMLLAAGMPGFDALCTSFSTLATGGFSVHSANIGYYDSFAIEAVVMIFMIVGGLNFILHYRLLTGRFRELLRDTETRFFLMVVATAAIVSMVALGLADLYPSAAAARHGLFQIVSAGTTGGFFTTEALYDWPPIVHILLILLMMFGATIGSTGGGLKAGRLLVLLKNAKRSILKAIHPRVVTRVQIGGKPVPERFIERVQMLFFVYIVVFCAATVLICASGLSVLEGASAVAGALGNAGLAIFGPDTGFYNLNAFAKIVLIFCMWIGRLEIITGLIVLAPSTYRT